jgi:lipoate-protein ligase B
MEKRIIALKLGCIPYGQALALQLRLRRALWGELALRGAEEADGFVITLEHPPVVTLGKRGSTEHLVAPQWLREQGVELFKIDRGGEATFHAPGQLVVYPVVSLDALDVGVVDLIRGMAGCLADSLDRWGVAASYDTDHPGLWTDEETPHKIASVGMRVSRGVTTHGAAINLSNDMTGFAQIVPCGMPGAPMTRLLDALDDDAREGFRLEDFRDDFLERFADFAGVELVETQVALPPRDEWIAGEAELAGE